FILGVFVFIFRNTFKKSVILCKLFIWEHVALMTIIFEVEPLLSFFFPRLVWFFDKILFIDFIYSLKREILGAYILLTISISIYIVLFQLIGVITGKMLYKGYKRRYKLISKNNLLFVIFLLLLSSVIFYPSPPKSMSDPGRVSFSRLKAPLSLVSFTTNGTLDATFTNGAGGTIDITHVAVYSRNQYNFTCLIRYPNGYIVEVGEYFNINCPGRVTNNPKKYDTFDLHITIYYTFTQDKKIHTDQGVIRGPFD
ncbi:MAG: hypothetical protein ABH851_00060, partial [Methanobacteriota archaeon]